MTTTTADWVAGLRRYLLVSLVGNLAWENMQLPLYTIWRDGTPREITLAVLHCTAGDFLLAACAMLGALVIVGNKRWPYERFGIVAASAIIAGLVYTVFSEWLNTEILGNWAYTAWMPRLPLIGTGLAPLAQWFVVPFLAFAVVCRHSRTPIETGSSSARQ